MKYIAKVLFAAFLACMSAVSCATYDDTDIKEAISDLRNRVEALEADVAENVSAIQSMVSLGSVQSFSIDEATWQCVTIHIRMLASFYH